ncbi:Ig-like domain-containing protein [Streptomyces griseoluteus]|uniref:Ig-like domain-containing protein n=1 Tax=Streptomyces griseoluteus TaxID=29306 RepID=UPI003401C23A
MRSIRYKGKLVVATAIAAVLGLASPAAADETTTTVTATPQTTTAGSPVHLQAQVACSSNPGGGLGVTFFDGSTELIPTVHVGADGRADYTTTFTPGTHIITATYNGNGNGNGSCAASSATTTVQVTSAPTPPIPTPTGCFLLCGLFGFSTGNINIHNNINT